MSRNEQLDAAVAELRSAGIRPDRIVRDKHVKVYFQHDGREKMCVLPGSPSDRMRGVRNTVTDIRRIIGRNHLDKSAKGVR